MILVTGATGHIGNVLVRKLYHMGEDIRVLIPPGESILPLDGIKVDVACCDIRDADSVRRAVSGCEVVFHLAGLISIAPGQSKVLQAVNIQGTHNIVESCLEEHVGRLIYVSSVHALPEPPMGKVIDENAESERELLGAYAKSKSAATDEVRNGIARRLDAVILFPSGVIGPYDFRMSELGMLFRMLMRNPNSRYKFYFDGAYDFVDVRDVVDALIGTWKLGKSGQGYILSGHRITIKNLFEEVEKASGGCYKLLKVPLWLVRTAAWFSGVFSGLFRKKAVLTPYSVAVLRSNSNISSDKAKKELGYHPRPISETVRDSIQWLKCHKLKSLPGTKG